jgi:nucleoside 2-deoxyribosyltransferase
MKNQYVGDSGDFGKNMHYFEPSIRYVKETHMKVYVASPFFNDTECEALSQVEQILRERGLTIFSPREHEVREGNVGSPAWSKETFLNDVAGINWCDIVVMLYWGNYSDSGTAWECGYAYAKGVPVVVVHADEQADSNLMVHMGCATNISLGDLPTYDFDALPRFEYTGDML